MCCLQSIPERWWGCSVGKGQCSLRWMYYWGKCHSQQRVEESASDGFRATAEAFETLGNNREQQMVDRKSCWLHTGCSVEISSWANASRTGQNTITLKYSLSLQRVFIIEIWQSWFFYIESYFWYFYSSVKSLINICFSVSAIINWVQVSFMLL